jgi:hypothetical protein
MVFVFVFQTKGRIGYDGIQRVRRHIRKKSEGVCADIRRPVRQMISGLLAQPAQILPNLLFTPLQPRTPIAGMAIPPAGASGLTSVCEERYI